MYSIPLYNSFILKLKLEMVKNLKSHLINMASKFDFKSNRRNAANYLQNRTLKSGWNVIEKIEKNDDSTGGFYSVCYKVRKNGETCFLKAFEFAKYYKKNPGKSVTNVTAKMLEAYKYEKDLSDYCRGKDVLKVQYVKEAGEEYIEGYKIPVVPYFIYNLADGDVRTVLRDSKKSDLTWKFKSLRDIAEGLKQLHDCEISHQDLKPSNILLFDGESRICDLGRSLCKAISSPYDNEPFTGDFIYAPPEILYGHFMNDWYERLFSTDCYSLGSMVVYYFSGISMTTMINKYIPDEFQWKKWKKGYEKVKPIVLNAFYKALYEFENSVPDINFRKELKCNVEKLCYPVPEERGYFEDTISKNNPYNLEKFISIFDVLYKKTLNRPKLALMFSQYSDIIAQDSPNL